MPNLVDVGTPGNPNSGDTLRDAFIVTNTNFESLVEELDGKAEIDHNHDIEEIFLLESTITSLEERIDDLEENGPPTIVIPETSEGTFTGPSPYGIGTTFFIEAVFNSFSGETRATVTVGVSVQDFQVNTTNSVARFAPDPSFTTWGAYSFTILKTSAQQFANRQNDISLATSIGTISFSANSTVGTISMTDPDIATGDKIILFSNNFPRVDIGQGLEPMEGEYIFLLAN